MHPFILGPMVGTLRFAHPTHLAALH